MENIVNWRQLSKKLTGNEELIRKNRIPDKYKEQVKELLKLLEWWEYRYLE